MPRSTLIIAAALAAMSVACSDSTTPTSPSPATNADPVPKLTAPAAQSPNNGELATSLTPTFTASAATVDLTGYQLQYRFQLFNDPGSLVSDSGLMNGTTWTPSAALTPNQHYTWKVRAETQGWLGPWSNTGSFMTPNPPSAYTGTIGNWQACAGLKGSAVVHCVWDTIHPNNSVGDFEVVKRVAWLLRGDGGGLLIKGSGENVVQWAGYSLSAARICFPDGHIFKIITDAGPGGLNAPTYSDNDFVDPSSYVPAIDPSKP